MTSDETRKYHYDRLKNYRHSVEYAEYAKAIGADIPQNDLPSLLRQRWEINEEIFHEFLGVLPPVGYGNGAFCMSEFAFADITAKYSRQGDKYYCEFARFPQKREGKKIIETPWGPAQTSREIAPGIIRHDTASHGGYYVSPERVAEMPIPLGEFKPWAGPNWYEEDCDWCIVAIAFPQFFSADDHDAALLTLKHYQPELYAKVAPEIKVAPVEIKQPKKEQPVDQRILRAASNALGYDADADQVAEAVAAHASDDTKTLRQNLRSRVEEFEAAGGRGVDLADAIDSLRIALAARSIGGKKRNR